MTGCLTFQHFAPLPNPLEMIGNKHETELPLAPVLIEFLVWRNDLATYDLSSKQGKMCRNAFLCLRVKKIIKVHTKKWKSQCLITT